MDKLAAQIVTERIRQKTSEVWVLLLAAHRGQAHKALGYQSWQEYCKREFDYSRQHAYRLIEHAEVIEAIKEVSPMGDIRLTERQTRALQPHMPEIVERIRELPEKSPKAISRILNDEKYKREAEMEKQRQNSDRAMDKIGEIAIRCPHCNESFTAEIDISNLTIVG